MKSNQIKKLHFNKTKLFAINKIQTITKKLEKNLH